MDVWFWLMVVGELMVFAVAAAWLLHQCYQAMDEHADRKIARKERER